MPPEFCFLACVVEISHAIRKAIGVWMGCAEGNRADGAFVAVVFPKQPVAHNSVALEAFMECIWAAAAVLLHVATGASLFKLTLLVRVAYAQLAVRSVRWLSLGRRCLSCWGPLPASLVTHECTGLGHAFLIGDDAWDCLVLSTNGYG